MIGINTFSIDYDKSNTVSTKVQRLVRLLQLQSPDAVIKQEIAALQRELNSPNEVVTVRVTIENKQA